MWRGASPGSTLRAAYADMGCVVVDRALLPAALVQRARAAADALARGAYAADNAPWRVLAGAAPGSLLKIDQPHLVDRDLLELVRHPAIGQLAAVVTGAERIRAWATQLLIKPSGGSAAGCVGWHTDQQYWPWFSGGTLTAWVALDDVRSDTGPVRVLGGSHRADHGGFGGDAFCQDLAAQESAWREARGEHGALNIVELTLPAGGVALFDARVLHSSGPNRSTRARVGLAIHLCTEQTEVTRELDPFGFTARLDDARECPMVWGDPSRELDATTDKGVMR